jgi:hypothetical protein
MLAVAVEDQDVFERGTFEERAQAGLDRGTFALFTDAG